MPKVMVSRKEMTYASREAIFVCLLAWCREEEGLRVRWIPPAANCFSLIFRSELSPNNGDTVDKNIKNKKVINLNLHVDKERGGHGVVGRGLLALVAGGLLSLFIVVVLVLVGRCRR